MPPFDYRTFEGVEKLPKEMSFGINTAEVSQKYANDDGRRTHRAIFRIPIGASRRVAEQLTRNAGNAWLKHVEGQGWKLLNTPRAQKKGLTIDLKSLELVHEFEFVGVFGKEPKPQRIEIPAGLVQRDPAQIISLAEATRALGLVRRPKVRTAQ